MSLTIEELKEQILQEHDPDDVLEALEISTKDLLDAFEDRVIRNAYKFLEFADEEEDAEI